MVKIHSKISSQTIKILIMSLRFLVQIYKQVPVGTKMRPSDGTDDFGDGNDWRSPESPMAPILVFNRFPIIPDRLERDLQVSEECITDRPTDGRTDGPTDGPTDRRMD